MSWSEELWGSIEDVYAAIVAHPFLAGLAAGDLPADVFAHYVTQDALYLRDYARALAVVGARAPTHADAGMFARHAADTVAVELSLHAELLPRLGLDPAAAAAAVPAPTTVAYTSYLLATAYGGSFAEGLGAVLPCYWIYQEVGRRLLAAGSPDPRYQLWIDTYGGDEFAGVVGEVLAVTDRIGPTLSAADRAAARRHFVTTARYEWMFWDAAWRRETWPV